jgi:hypothetical protein
MNNYLEINNECSAEDLATFYKGLDDFLVEQELTEDMKKMLEWDRMMDLDMDR